MSVERIRVAFPVVASVGWLGGMNYIKNLLYAVSRLEESRIEPVILTGRQSDPKLLAMYEPYAEVVRSQIFDARTLPWLLHTLQARFLGTDSQLDRLIRDNGIRILSHSLLGTTAARHYRSIGWIPDFQHLHLPGMFTAVELARRNVSYTNVVKRCDRVIVSSNNALEDYRTFAPEYVGKARVLHFVAQPEYRPSGGMTRGDMEAKYGFSGKFFYLPNQLWKHKNHLVVFRAVKLLRERGERVLVLCSGHPGDHRNSGHVAELAAFVADNGLDDSIRLLGLIDFADLTWLMQNCIAIINPSLFEGWSTTVEEAKSIGKGMILSNLRVHQEQNPPGSVYFDPRDPEALADILGERWRTSEGGPDAELQAGAAAALEERTREFARRYQEIVIELAGELER